jgi:hypothetical protein
MPATSTKAWVERELVGLVHRFLARQVSFREFHLAFMSAMGRTPPQGFAPAQRPRWQEAFSATSLALPDPVAEVDLAAGAISESELRKRLNRLFAT